MAYVKIGGLSVAAPLHALLVEDVLPPLGLAAPDFFAGFAALLRRLRDENRTLLARRAELQAAIDVWWAEHRERRPSIGEQEAFLRGIGYMEPLPEPFRIGTEGVDAEVATIAGPQLVVPLSNARYALNAANARWGSLYDALYGTDALGLPPPSGPYDPTRGQQVVARARAVLDDAVPLAAFSHAGVTRYEVRSGRLAAHSALGVSALKAGVELVGWRGSPEAPTHIVTRHHGLHAELVIDRADPIGAADPAGLRDVVLEAAVTTIMDLEDSVAAVDGADKALVYRSWLGLMRGDLADRFTKGGETVTRTLHPDRTYDSPGGEAVHLPGRSLMFVRNVGHLMTTPAVLLDGEEAFEGQVDAVITAAIGAHDVRGLGRFRNSRAGSVYIVKPKMHGPAEAAFANRLFAAAEELIGLSRNTLKIGVMDEERRTSLNLAATVAAVRERIVFLNTGFLDRTGDEIHTAMAAGPVIRKEEMRGAAWFKAYEENNVDVGLAAGFRGRAQIGKGMWAAPDRMADMLATKIGHPRAGASAAWVPSPTAATLHAIHYHQVDVAAVQAGLAEAGPRAKLADLLTTPLAPSGCNWAAEDVEAELSNNAQGILGYVVRWIDQGVGCSKVPDIHDVGLMEDRATCRISSQHIANWLAHGVVTPEQVDAALTRMAAVVDRQNAGDPLYRPMAPDPAQSIAFQTARALVFEGAAQPSGYTEPLLHAARLRLKGDVGCP
ncbi:MAG: malate synthase G [Sphingomonadaceae bacterium]|nr:malate synthase G [Sphingomonadaceae bacterium]